MTKSRGLIAKRGTRQAWMAEQQGRHFCGCGCGEAIPLRPEHYSEGIPRYLHGHNSRVANPHTRREPLPEAMPCACGCGRLAGSGKQFVSGHNGRGIPRSAETRAKISAAHRGRRTGRPAWNAKPKPPPEPCACGCGSLATPGRRFISGHNGRGQRTARYTGRYQRIDGVVFTHDPDHPYALADGFIQEHRLMLERHLRVTDPNNPHLIRLGDRLYLRRDVVVHHRNEVKSDNRIENLQPLTNGEHVALHHEQRRKHRH